MFADTCVTRFIRAHTSKVIVGQARAIILNVSYLLFVVEDIARPELGTGE
jgi:hypothetical protein